MSDEKQDRPDVESAVQRCYSTWGTTYFDEYYGVDAPYPPVHADLLRRLIIDSGARQVLDVGCGPASFLRLLANDGLDLYGFDLTSEMVEEGKKVFSLLGMQSNRIWQGNVLDASAYTSGPVDAPEKYDATICTGVLPHIPANEDEKLFSRLNDALHKGGLAVVEARNQLFSLFTLNRYSYDFFCDELIRADQLQAMAGNEATKVRASIKSLEERFRMDLPPVRRGKVDEPGYDEVLSRTHNPLVLRETFAAAGFTDIKVLFYHFHSLPPMLANDSPEFFMRSSISMERPEDWRGYFMASAFMLCGIKQ